MKYNEFKNKTNLDEQDLQRGISIISILVMTVAGSVGIQLAIKLLTKLLNDFTQSRALIGVSLVTSFIASTYIIIQRDKKIEVVKVNDWKDLFYEKEEEE